MTYHVERPQDHVQQAAAVPPVLALRRLIFGHRVTRMITIAAQLGLADHLAAGPKRADELAALVQADAPALYRLLRALASVGVFAEVEPGRFALRTCIQSGQTSRTVSCQRKQTQQLLKGKEVQSDEHHYGQSSR